MTDVHPGPGELGELDVPGHDARLGHRRPAGQPELAGDLTLVAAGVGAGELRVLRVLGDHAVEGPDVLQRPAHQPGVGDTPSVVGEHPYAGPRPGHQAELGQFRPAQSLADRTHGYHLGVAVAPADVGQVFGRLGGVGDRIGVGHRQHGGEAAAGRGPGAGGDGLGVLPAGFAEVGVQVDQSGQRDQTGGVDALRIGSQVGRVDEPAVADRQVATALAGPIGAGDQQVGHSSPPSS